MLKFLFGLSMSMIWACSHGQSDTLLRGFRDPHNGAKPRVWWHWMNGNITKDGIRKDLEWMHRSGIGGFQNFDASLSTPQIVEKRLTYMTPEWKDAFRFATLLADSLGLEMAIAGSPGWSETGGPWVKPEDGMKKLVWSEQFVTGGTSGIVLTKAPTNTGPFQNVPMQGGLGEAPKNPPMHHGNVAVVAFKIPENDKRLSDLKAVVSSSGGAFDLAQLTDGDLSTTVLLPRDSANGYAWIQFTFPEPVTIKAVSMMGGGDKGPWNFFGEFKDTRRLMASDDGVQFRFISFIPAGNLLHQTMDVTPTTARYFRVTVKNPGPPFNANAIMGGSGGTAKPAPGTEIAELNLHTVTRINWFEEKSAFVPSTNLSAKPTPASEGIQTAEIIELSGKVTSDGTLNWTAPPGNWKIMCFGYSLMGINNHPASPEATGLEVDKMNIGAIERYFENYLEQYKGATGGLMGRKGLQYMVTDSWEAGAQNWTNDLPQQFQKRRGYNMIPWLPALAGYIITSSEASEKFLWDFRKTLSELVAEYHYDGLTTILNRYGMKRYSESHENGRTLIADGMDVKRTAAVPMSAIWVPGGIGGGQQMHEADIRESASVAHIYGQNLVAAESLTAFGPGGNAWSFSPERLKPTADLELASGLNRFVIHTSVHQPEDTKLPGLGLGPFGQWFNRHETWAEQAKVWTNYLARSSYMLQQGKFVADIVYYYGEDNNITSLFGTRLPDIPKGYAFDFINAHALVNMLSVKNGKLVTASGMRYSLLVLDSNSRKMRLDVLKKIRELVKAGAVVVGPRPSGTAGLIENESEFKTIADELFGSNSSMRAVGKGKVYTGTSIQQALDDMNLAADVQYYMSKYKDGFLFVHRTLPGKEIYWINNRSNEEQVLDLSLRVADMKPEIWHPETGLTQPVSYTIRNGRTVLQLPMVPNDAYFVVFSGRATTDSVSLPATRVHDLQTVEGKWEIQFEENLGAPASIQTETLTSWTEHNDAGVKYFSGTAKYRKEILADKSWFDGGEIWLDLGEVKNIAEVFVNGKSVGSVWKKPFRINVGSKMKPGSNQIEIQVTNLWVNRLIGDMQPGAKKFTYTTMPFYQANSRLLPSGLLGPVKFINKKN